MDNPTQPFIVNPGEGRAIAVADSRLFLKLASGDTGNAMSITEYELPPHFSGPPPHKHKVFEHAWYVLEGELTVQLGDETKLLSRGSFLFIPKQTVHSFANSSGAVTRMLAIDTPGGFEHYYDDLQAAFSNGQAIDQNIIKDIQRRYDTYPPEYDF